MNSKITFVAALVLQCNVWAQGSLQQGRQSPSDSAVGLVPTDSMYSSAQGGVTFRANNIDFETALALFAESNGLQLRLDTNIIETVHADIRNLPFSQAMEQLIQNKNLQWKIEQNTLFVFPRGAGISKDITPSGASLLVENAGGGWTIYKVEYPRLQRSGAGNSSATISGTSSGEAGSVQLSTQDELIFWTELEGQLSQMLSNEGKLIMSRLSGIIYVLDYPERQAVIESFLAQVIPAATRQVEITARIYEVTLDDDQSLGVDWSRMEFDFNVWSNGVSGVIGSANTPVRNDLKTATINMNIGSDDGRFAMIVSALREQGEVRAVSQPHVVTLNNQPALVKVGTDYPYFSATVTQDATTGLRDVVEQVQVVTVGVVLSVTPQISGDGWITLGIDPLVSDLVGTITSIYGSTAPIIDVKQSSSLVRLQNLHTVRISGLLHTKQQKIQRKIPLLGEIPFLGALFRWNYEKEVRKELVIFITPRIL
jgi:MSHA biogenesis protein MshL